MFTGNGKTTVTKSVSKKKTINLTNKVNPVKIVKIPVQNQSNTLREDWEEFDAEDIGGEIYLKLGHGYNPPSFGFTINSNSVPYCCGMSELGDFDILEDSKKINSEAKIELVKNALLKFIQENDRHTYFFTLINNPACNLIKEAIKDGQLFTLVKTFVNGNSNNKNELYVSNN